MIADWLDFLNENAPAWNLPAGNKWTCLFHNNYHAHSRSINLLWFFGRAKFPQVITKLYREPEILQREFANLERAFAASPRHVPRPLHFGKIGDLWTLWMEGVPGHRFQPRDVRSKIALGSALDAIVSVHSGLRMPQNGDDGARWQRMVLEPTKTLSNFGSSSLVQENCSALASTIRPEWIASLPIIPQHGDLFFGNILSHNGESRIVDWESFGAIDIPLHDLITFCFSLFRVESENLDHLPDWIVSEMGVLIDRYCAAMGFDAPQSQWLLPLALVNWFHLQWSDGRKEFSEGLYRAIEQYFLQPNRWGRFSPIASTATFAG